MPADTFQTLSRQWATLRAIPRYPQSITVNALMDKLRHQDFTPARRTIERDLKGLSAHFAVTVDECEKVHRWSWAKDANFEFMPRLTIAQALALKHAQTHGREMMPAAMFADLAPVFAAADSELVRTGYKDWHTRTAYVSPMFVLEPPNIDPDVHANVHHAFARRLRLFTTYRKLGSTEPSRVTLHPLGLLIRGRNPYLVCTIDDQGEPRWLPLQRMSDTAVSDVPGDEPKGFDFHAWCKTQLTIKSEGKIRLRARFDSRTAAHLRETPISKDQKWTPVKGTDKVDITGTVDNDEQFKRWLLSFGSELEVMKPAGLRRWVAGELAKTLARYA